MSTSFLEEALSLFVNRGGPDSSERTWIFFGPFRKFHRQNSLFEIGPLGVGINRQFEIGIECGNFQPLPER